MAKNELAFSQEAAQIMVKALKAYRQYVINRCGADLFEDEIPIVEDLTETFKDMYK